MKYLNIYKIFENTEDDRLSEERLSKERLFKVIVTTFKVIENNIKKMMSRYDIDMVKISSKGFGDGENEWFWFDDLNNMEMVDYKRRY